MSREYHSEHCRPYQDSIQLRDHIPQPIPRQQTYQAASAQNPPPLPTYYHTRPLPPVPSPVGQYQISSRLSGFVVRQSPRIQNPSLIDEDAEEPSQNRGVHTLIRPRWPTAVSRIANLIKRFVVDYIVEWWLLEIGSLCVSAACMSTIFWVMVFYDGKEIPKWPLGFTFNGFISVFSVCAKASLILPTAEGIGQLKWSHFKENAGPMMDFERIDLASRGPWGALLLLGRFLGRTKRMKLLTLGAAVILFAVPLDFVFQQLVTYPSEWVVVGNATIPRSVNYDTLAGVFYQEGARRINPVSSMVAAIEPIWLGLNSTRGGTLPELKGSCPTSNCTWEPFESLSACSQCIDISSTLIWDCDTGPAEWISNATLGGDAYPNVTSCGYSISPDGKSRIFLSGYVLNDDGTQGEALSTRLFSLTSPDPSLRTPVFNNGSLNFQHIPNPIADFFVAGTAQGENGVYKNTTPVVHECNVHWCVKSLQTDYKWGRAQENTTKVVQLDSNQEYPWKGFNISGTIVQKYTTNFSLTLPSRPQSDLAYNTFKVINQTMLETILAFDEILPSYVTTENSTSTAKFRWLNAGQGFGSPATVVDMPADSNPWLPPNNITKQLELIADTMTIVMRNTPNATNKLQLVQGTAWDQKTFIHIRWGWAVWPILLLALGLAFLIATVSKCSKEESVVRVWKNSVLAVLVNGLGDDMQKSIGSNPRMGEIKDRVRGMEVELTE